MINLQDLLTKIKEQNLSKQQIEEYHSALVTLYAEMQIALAELRKAKALHFLSSKEPTVRAKEVEWGGSEKGQREIELSHWSKAAEKMLSSLRSRLYSTY